jgi:hypothetical protein
MHIPRILEAMPRLDPQAAEELLAQVYRKLRRLAARRLRLLLLVPLLTGCQTVEKYSLTYRLWDNGEMRKFSDPAADPHLALFEATNHADVLVQYDAWSEKRSRIMRRSYYLGLNQGRIADGREPTWLKPPMPEDLMPIRIIPAQFDPANPSSKSIRCAVTSRDGQSFTLYSCTGATNSFDLPVYVESSSMATRLVLSPFAAAGDTVMVGGVAAVGCFLLWVQAGAPIR